MFHNCTFNPRILFICSSSDPGILQTYTSFLLINKSKVRSTKVSLFSTLQQVVACSYRSGQETFTLAPFRCYSQHLSVTHRDALKSLWTQDKSCNNIVSCWSDSEHNTLVGKIFLWKESNTNILTFEPTLVPCYVQATPIWC